MTKHKLTAVEADSVNASAGFARNRGDDPEEVKGVEVGDSVDVFVTHDGTKVVLVLGPDNSLSAVVVDSDEGDNEDETPVTA